MMRKETTHNLKHTTSAVKHSAGNVMVWACRTKKGIGPLVLTDDLTVD